MPPRGPRPARTRARSPASSPGDRALGRPRSPRPARTSPGRRPGHAPRGPSSAGSPSRRAGASPTAASRPRGPAPRGAGRTPLRYRPRGAADSARPPPGRRPPAWPRAMRSAALARDPSPRGAAGRAARARARSATRPARRPRRRERRAEGRAPRAPRACRPVHAARRPRGWCRSSSGRPRPSTPSGWSPRRSLSSARSRGPPRRTRGGACRRWGRWSRGPSRAGRGRTRGSGCSRSRTGRRGSPAGSPHRS